MRVRDSRLPRLDHRGHGGTERKGLHDDQTRQTARNRRIMMERADPQVPPIPKFLCILCCRGQALRCARGQALRSARGQALPQDDNSERAVVLRERLPSSKAKGSDRRTCTSPPFAKCRSFAVLRTTTKFVQSSALLSVPVRPPWFSWQSWLIIPRAERLAGSTHSGNARSISASTGASAGSVPNARPCCAPSRLSQKLSAMATLPLRMSVAAWSASAIRSTR
jgi:hypothetical protein